MQYLKICFSCAAAVVALSAQAETDSRFHPYLYAGASYQYSYLDYGTIDTLGGETYLDLDRFYEDTFDGGGIYLGARLNDYFGIELGATTTNKGENNLRIDTNTYFTYLKSTIQIRSFTLDALGYFPIRQVKNLELIGSFGVAQTEDKVSVSVVEVIDDTSDTIYDDSDSERKTDFRLGLGMQYAVSDHFRVRGMFNYENTQVEGLDNRYLWSLGSIIRFEPWRMRGFLTTAFGRFFISGERS